ncbi:DEAD-box ATP-dependent RNA helicase 17 [Coccomyxa sp. Obi]|nr:DEAD-box ATP-dependent RNA helicase 17 [Coccomyxa sp. Obi]
MGNHDHKRKREVTRLEKAPTTQAAAALKGYALEEAPDKASQRPAGSSLRKIESQQRENIHKSAAVHQSGQDEPPPKAQQEERPLSHELDAPAIRTMLENGEPQHVESSEEEDVLEALAGFQKRDAGLRAAEPGSGAAGGSPDEESDEERGFVSFIDERKAMRYPTKRRVKEEQDTKKKKVKHKGTKSNMKTGELVHAESAVPASQKLEVFGPVDSSSFRGLGLAEALSDHLEEINFVTPTRIQQSAIPVLLRGRDALVNAPTGSGKTLAYLAPIINDLQAQEPRVSRAEGTHALIIVPTRELCLQIADVLTLILRRYIWLVGGAIYGGENRAKEKARLRKGVTVLVATPGRLLDHLQNTQSFRTEELRWLVLDEADRLLDLGFEQKIGEILAITDRRTSEAGNRRRQTVLLSATLHSKLDSLASLSLQNPAAIGFQVQAAEGHLHITAAEGPSNGGNAHEADAHSTDQEQFHIPKLLKQQVVEVPSKMRLVVLAALLRQICAAQRAAKVVLFMSSCDAVEFVHQMFSEVFELLEGAPLLPVPIFKLHGNLAQGVRTHTFLEFSRCKSGVLICTDVAARGLDFPEVTSIIQYDPPGEASEYVHRVGRTARMGKVGEAFLFLLPCERGYLAKLEATGVRLDPINLLPALDLLPSQPGQQGRPGRTLDTHTGAHAVQARLVDAVSEDPSLRSLASDAFRSSVRAYAAHPAALKDVFHVKRLHLGHVAHSFALREAPSMLGKSSNKAELKRKKAEERGGRKTFPAKHKRQKQ